MPGKKFSGTVTTNDPAPLFLSQSIEGFFVDPTVRRRYDWIVWFFNSYLPEMAGEALERMMSEGGETRKAVLFLKIEDTQATLGIC